METIKLEVGTYSTNNNGMPIDRTRPVEFEAEEMGTWADYSDENRPTKQTLYRTADGRLIVYVADETRWQGETSTYNLHEVSEGMLGPNGDFEMLGRECGFGRPLTLDEAVTTPD